LADTESISLPAGDTKLEGKRCSLSQGLCAQGLDSLRDGEFACFHLCGIGYELFNFVLNLVSDPAEYFFFLVDQSTGGIGIYDIPVQNSEREGEYRVPFLGCVTYGDHLAEWFLQ
jgi:hypothetical protein